jgi:hypothetical protein
MEEQANSQAQEETYKKMEEILFSIEKSIQFNLKFCSFSEHQLQNLFLILKHTFILSLNSLSNL